ncbi:MAG: hypothetical protein QXT86_12940 [Archaeoglobaceae archaeon]
MRYRITFERKFPSLPCFVANYRPLLNRADSFLAYVVAEKLKEKGILTDVTFDLKLVEEELSKIVKKVGNVFLASCIYLHPTVEEVGEESKESIVDKFLRAIKSFDLFTFYSKTKAKQGSYLTKDYLTTEIGVTKNVSALKMCANDSSGLDYDFTRYRTYIMKNLDGKGAVANKIWFYYLTEARRLSFVIESDLSAEEIYDFLSDREFSFFGLRKYFTGNKFECVSVEESDDEIVRFIPCAEIYNVAKEYDIRVINDVIMREPKHFALWFGQKVNGVFCAIGKRKNGEEENVVDEKIKRVYELRDLDLRLGSVLIGADEVKVDTSGLRKVNGICGLCRYEGEVYINEKRDYWDNFTFHNRLHSTEYLCESCLKLKGLASRKSEYRRFKQVGGQKYDINDEVELPSEGYVILSQGVGMQASFYFAEANYVMGDVKFLMVNIQDRKFLRSIDLR